MAAEDSPGDDVKLVKAVVGLPASEHRIGQLEKRLELLERTVRELRQQ
jgi:hypothetical protein